jgi:ceramide synthetase
MGFEVYKFLYFTSSVAWGYMVLKDEEYFPKSLGGSGDITKGFVNHVTPYNNPDLKMYGLITMGFHFGCFFTHLFESNKREDYVEIMLHHVVAMYLFFGYYMGNVWRVGTVIAFLHDIADVTAMLSKSLSETKYSNLTAICFIFNMFVWFYTRLFVLPYECIY